MRLTQGVCGDDPVVQVDLGQYRRGDGGLFGSGVQDLGLGHHHQDDRFRA
ncbi:hypothetical protein GCM10010191_01880 [Actinomadura vinacea]|uniref:Uncharacterized protein n=1 Tax=Actinomadura vinacea TaxID=115336 RepID=A0ABN3IBM9_9ACTN